MLKYMKKFILAAIIVVAACNTPEEEQAPRGDIVETASDSTAIAPDSVRSDSANTSQ
jgi:hypothetical protein